MRRVVSLSLFSVIGFAVITTVLIPKDADAIDAKLTGIPVSLNADQALVSSVVVEVKGGWVNTDEILLDISITGYNEQETDRGRQVVPMSSTTIFPDTQERDLVHVLVQWDDIAESFHAEGYIVCVQVLAGGKPLGNNECSYFSMGFV